LDSLPPDDPGAPELAAAIQSADVRIATRRALAALDPALTDYPELLAAVSAAAREFIRPSP
jgi:hypothetical protein